MLSRSGSATARFLRCLLDSENLQTFVDICPEYFAGTRFVAVDDMLVVVSC